MDALALVLAEKGNLWYLKVWQCSQNKFVLEAATITRLLFFTSEETIKKEGWPSQKCQSTSEATWAEGDKEQPNALTEPVR